MNIFSKLFGKKQSTVLNNTPFSGTKDNNISTLEELIPDKDLFIESQEPPRQNMQTEQPGKITLFLNRNYHALGVHDGYEYHSSENLTTGKRKICPARFHPTIS